MNQTVKAMRISGLSYNQIEALERELLWYSDQLLYRSVVEAVKISDDLVDKVEKLGLIGAVAKNFSDIHHQMLSGMAVLQNDPDIAQSRDAKQLSLLLVVPRFDAIATALNSPFLDPKSKHEGNFWVNIKAEPEVAKALRKQHQSLVKAFKQAVAVSAPSEPEGDEDSYDEESVVPDTLDLLPTMPTPRGEQ